MIMAVNRPTASLSMKSSFDRKLAKEKESMGKPTLTKELSASRKPNDGPWEDMNIDVEGSKCGGQPIPIPPPTNPQDTVTKVILWTNPRSLSTSLTKCLSFVPDSIIWHEPYIGALYYGQDARYQPPGKDVETQAAAMKLPENAGHDASQISYEWCKQQLESDPEPGKKLVFVKGMSYAISTKFDAIPRGYKHSFLIRHPAKVMTSWKRSIWNEVSNEPYDTFKLTDCPENELPPGYFFKESYDLYEHVKENYDPNPIVIDADDLQNNPSEILKSYCNAVNIPYSDDLLNWDPSDKITYTWKVRTILLKLNQLDSFTFNDNALRSSNFQKLKEGQSLTDLSDDLRHCVDFAMPFYEKMYKERLKC